MEVLTGSPNCRSATQKGALRGPLIRILAFLREVVRLVDRSLQDTSIERGSLTSGFGPELLI